MSWNTIADNRMAIATAQGNPRRTEGVAEIEFFAPSGLRANADGQCLAYSSGISPIV
jgi:hypothetical protein